MRVQPHILVADDDADIREMVQILLQEAGFRVSTADTTGGVLQLVATERFDAMLFDYWMPQTTGIELCRRIRTFDKSTPILIFSGAVNKSDTEAATLAGAQGFVEKPFRSSDLICALRSVLETADC